MYLAHLRRYLLLTGVDGKTRRCRVLLPAQVRNLKQHINQLTDQASEAKLTLSSLATEAEQLQEQIVQVGMAHRLPPSQQQQP